MKPFLYASMLAVLCVATAAQAQDRPAHGAAGPRDMAPRGPHRFAGDFRHFGPDDRALWRSGGWRHDYHDGRLGWWWIVDGMWYWYDDPIYPYPGTVSVVTYAPPPVEAYTPPPAVPVTAPPRFRYYCPEHGYYPQVQTCPTDFVRQPIP